MMRKPHGKVPYPVRLDYWRNCMMVPMVVLLSLNVGIFVVLLAGMSQSSEMMMATGKATVEMRNETKAMKEDVSEYVRNLLSPYPKNQDAIVLEQIFGTMGNVHRITSRVNLLLEDVTPTHIVSISSHVDSILQRVEGLISSTDQEQTSQIVGKVFSIAAKVDSLLSAITSEQVADFFNNANAMAAHISHIAQNVEDDSVVSKLTTLSEQATLIIARLNDLHELRIQV